MVAKRIRSMSDTRRDAKRVVRRMRQSGDVEERVLHTVLVRSEVYRNANGASIGSAYDVNAMVQQ